MIDFTNANNDTTELYDYLIEIANGVMTKYTKTLDDIVHKLSKDIDTLSNEELRSYMAKLCIEAYNLSINREQSSLKEACANALYKEGLATSFNNTSGTVEARKNQSVIDTMDKQAVQMLYSTISDLFKAKADEAHRLTSTLNGILMSRAADAKLQYNPRNVGTDFMDPENNPIVNDNTPF